MQVQNLKPIKSSEDFSRVKELSKKEDGLKRKSEGAVLQFKKQKVEKRTVKEIFDLFKREFKDPKGMDLKRFKCFFLMKENEAFLEQVQSDKKLYIDCVIFILKHFMFRELFSLENFICDCVKAYPDSFLELLSSFLAKRNVSDKMSTAINLLIIL